jgi:hypothetical protein
MAIAVFQVHLRSDLKTVTLILRNAETITNQPFTPMQKRRQPRIEVDVFNGGAGGIRTHGRLPVA